MADLEAEVDEPPSDFEEDWEEAPAEAQENEEIASASASAVDNPTVHANEATDEEADVNGGGDDGHTALASQLEDISLHSDDRPVSPLTDSCLRVPPPTSLPAGTTQSVHPGAEGQVPPPGSATQYALTRAESAATEGPMTPRNDVGPFILDGSAGRAVPQTGIGNLESVVHEE